MEIIAHVLPTGGSQDIPPQVKDGKTDTGKGEESVHYGLYFVRINDV